MPKSKIGKFVKEELKDFLEENGLELYNVEFIKDGKDKHLRVFIDHKWEAGMNNEDMIGISTDECEMVSRFLSDRLDEKEPIQNHYMLEVSSPGMDRPLLREEHYDRYIGHEVDVSLYKAIDGRKKISGELVDLKEDVLEIKTEGGIILKLPMKSIAKTKLKVVI